MIAPSDLDHVASARFDRTPCREMERWFVQEYIPTWVEAGTAASADLRSILDYWGVPLHVSNPNGNQWLTTPGEVVEMPLLLSWQQMSDLEEAAHKRGLTASAMVPPSECPTSTMELIRPLLQPSMASRASESENT